MNTLNFNTSSLTASVPSAGLWRRAADLYWTGWTQYAASMNADTRLRTEFPVYRHRDRGNGVGAEAPTPQRRDDGVKAEALIPDAPDARLVDRAA
jgi:hypothetical protein